jgi:transposase
MDSFRALVQPAAPRLRGRSSGPTGYIRQDFFLARTFQNLEDLNLQFPQWLAQVANRRRHGMTHRLITVAFASERLSLWPLPL